MKLNLDPNEFSKFYMAFEQALWTAGLGESDWSRDILHISHATCSDYSETNDWRITYSNERVRVEFGIVERFVDAHFFDGIKMQKRGLFGLTLEGEPPFWHIPLEFSIDINVTGEDKEIMEKELNEIMSRCRRNNP